MSVRKFSSVSEVHRYLADCGYEISLRSIYNHRKGNYLVELPGGGFSQKDVDLYIKNIFLDKQEKSDLRKEKTRAELKKIRAQADHWTTKAKKERGELIEVSAVEQQFAARVAFLRADFEQFFYSKSPQIVSLVEGNPDFIPDLIEFGIDEINEWLGRYSRPLNLPDLHRVNEERGPGEGLSD